MWYVVQVRSGTEEKIRLQCENNILRTVLERSFVPYYEEQRHIKGEWISLKKILFPGYIFVVTEDLKELYQNLKSIIGFTKLIGTGQEIVPLTEGEIRFLQRIGGEEQIVEMSRGVIEESQVIIMSGPLMGMEGCIRKIDRHKRKAWMEIDMFGRKQMIQVGLEIFVKK